MLRGVSLFSGAGGFCEGVRLAGWKVACAVESDAQACLTHAANFDDVPLFKGDIVRFLEEEQPGVPGLDQLVAQNIDVVYGGPPCQGFSQIGPRDLNDPRNFLYEEFVRVVPPLMALAVARTAAGLPIEQGVWCPLPEAEESGSADRCRRMARNGAAAART
jgi:DNA (cytosine-5)-methyltransferase 1